MRQILKKLIKRILYGKGLTQNYKIGNFKFHNTLIDTMVPDLVSIGDNFISAPGSRIIAHDASLFVNFNVYRVEKVTVGNNVFLGANAIILPGVTVGDNVIIGAGSVVTKDIPANSIVVGNPAKVVGSPEEYYQKCLEKSVLVTAPSSFEKLWRNERLNHDDIYKFRQIVNEKLS